jgi:hypothetical protein
MVSCIFIHERIVFALAAGVNQPRVLVLLYQTAFLIPRKALCRSPSHGMSRDRLTALAARLKSLGAPSLSLGFARCAYVASDRFAAVGTDASVKFTGFRHVPLAAQD